MFSRTWLPHAPYLVQLFLYLSYLHSTKNSFNQLAVQSFQWYTTSLRCIERGEMLGSRCPFFPFCAIFALLSNFTTPTWSTFHLAPRSIFIQYFLHLSALPGSKSGLRLKIASLYFHVSHFKCIQFYCWHIRAQQISSNLIYSIRIY